MVQRTFVALVAYRAPRSISHISLCPRKTGPQVRHYAPDSPGRFQAIKISQQPSPQVSLNDYAQKHATNDLGIIPDTFIMPTGPKRPSLLYEPRLRWKLEKHRLRSRLTDLQGLLTYKFVVKGKPYPKIGLRRIVPTATALHRQMYTAFAEADTDALSSICAEGLLASLRLRIASRSRSEVQRWTMHKYTHASRVVSHRAAMFNKTLAIRQVIVRIRSIQSLTKTISGLDGEEDSEVEGTGKETPTDEYLVMQRRIWKEKEGPWMVWGTTQESDVKAILGQNMKVAAG